MKSKKNSIILHGNGPDQNRGCQAIRFSTKIILNKSIGTHRSIYSYGSQNLSILEHELPDDYKICYENFAKPYSPSFFMKQIARRLLNRWPGQKVYKYFADAKALLSLGGDNISLDYGKPNWYIYTLLEAERRGVPAVIWGASVGPFTSQPKLEKKYSIILKRLSLILVRETLSQEYLSSLGITDNVKLVADPAFVLPKKEPEKISQSILNALKEGAMGLNLSPLVGKFDGANWKEKAVDYIIAVCRKIDCPIILIPHVIISNSDDYAFMDTVIKKLPIDLKKRVQMLDARAYSCSQIKWVIFQLKVFAGARTHATIAALSSCVPTFSIGYSVKARGINRDIFGHENWICHVSELSPSEFGDRIQDLWQQREAVRYQLEKIMPLYIDKAWEAGDILKKAIE